MLLPLRASEGDRLRVVETLKRGYVEGRLSTSTFEARVAVAHATSSTRVLRSLLADLRARWLALDALERRWMAREPVEPVAALEASLLLSRARAVRIVVGRSRSCDLVLRSMAVSRRHAALEPSATGWHVTDLGSTNGTYLDGVRVERAPISAGSWLWLGDALLHMA